MEDQNNNIDPHKQQHATQSRQADESAHQDQAQRSDGAESMVPIAKQELERLKQEAAMNLDGWKRAKADYANLKKETDARQQEYRVISFQMAVHTFLPLYDLLVHALKSVDSGIANHAWVEGIRKIVQQFEKTLADKGVKIIAAEGQKFNPKEHEAIGAEKNDAIPEDTVLRVVQNGFSYNNDVIQPARVIVSKKVD